MSPPADDRLIRRILRVDHGGEYGAVRIYRSQLAVARWRTPRLAPFLAEILEHEEAHEARFRALMPARAARPCRLMWLWGVGGGALGLLTALLGSRAVLACTAAVERTVHVHLQDQIRAVSDRDPELRRTLQEILAEEEAHLAFAETRLPQDRRDWLEPPIAAVTEALIWLSTRGESARLTRALDP
ncbi:MAG: hypothetical protein A2882_05265 [Phenylobacterium sp. RIFCSPHIGHO2_01_FULL_70_10]|nr:MAG: hypothetical protein A2882_05265 [Phenylobacterium sp. RIFCSPHIGHO2_01_FULL_70_10]